MTDEDFQKKITGCHLILTYFSQPACTVCKTLRPKVEALVAGYQGLEFQYIDTITSPLLRGQYMIFTVPTILLFYKGKEVRRWSRFLSVEEIKEELERYRQEEPG